LCFSIMGRDWSENGYWRCNPLSICLPFLRVVGQQQRGNQPEVIMS
jgi:hypothetical protein